MGNTFSRKGKKKNELIHREGKNERKENKWIKAACINPDQSFTYICTTIGTSALVLNEREFLIAITDNERDFVLKYNVRLDQWTQFLSLPPGIFTSSVDVQIDRSNNRIFFVKDNRGCSDYDDVVTSMERTSVVDLHTGLLIHRISRHRKYKDVYYAAMVEVDGVMHRIKGPHHTIWNETKVDWEPIGMSMEFLEFNLRNPPRDYSLVYGPSKKVVLMIGGFKEFEEVTTGVWRYSMSSGIWEEMKDENSDSFMFHGKVIHSVLSSNERYVIIAVRGSEFLTDIRSPLLTYETEFRSLDIDNNGSYKLREYCLTPPVVKGPSGNEYGIRTFTTTGGLLDAKLLISGWIRKQETSEIAPLDIMQLINEWYSSEIVRLHCFTLVHELFDGKWHHDHIHQMLQFCFGC